MPRQYTEMGTIDLGKDRAAQESQPAPSVSVIIPAHDAQEYLSFTIESVLAQTLLDWELVVVDDGSHDATVSIGRQYAARDSRVRLLQQPHAGVSTARNHGLAATDPRSAYVMFLDADDILEPEALQILASALAADLDAVGAHGVARLIDSQGQPQRRPQSQQTMEWGGDRQGMVAGRPQAWPRRKPTTFSVLALSNCIATPGQGLLRRRALHTTSPFTTIFRSTPTCEDWEMWLRLSSRGHLVHVDRIVLHYRQHSTNASRSKWRMRLGKLYVRLTLSRSRALTDEQRRLMRLGARWRSRDISVYWWNEARHSLDRRHFRSAVSSAAWALLLRFQVLMPLIPMRTRRGTAPGGPLPTPLQDRLL